MNENPVPLTRLALLAVVALNQQGAWLLAETGCPGDGTNSAVVAEYVFDEGSGTNTANSGTDGAVGNAVMINSVTFSTNTPDAGTACGWSADFPNSGSGSTTPAIESGTNYDALANASNFTIMAWVKRESTSTNSNTSARIVSDTSSTTLTNTTAGFEFRFSGTSGTLALRVNGKEVSTSVGGISPTNGAWHHVAVVFDSTRPATNTLTRNAHFYVDGVQRGDGNVLTNIAVTANTNRLTLGNSSVSRGVANALVGKLDEVHILRGYSPDAVGDGSTNAIIACYRDAYPHSGTLQVTCPGNLSVYADIGQDHASGVALGSPTISGGCGVSSLTNNAPAQFPLGTNTVTWTAISNDGQTNTCAQTVVVTPLVGTGCSGDVPNNAILNEYMTTYGTGSNAVNVGTDGSMGNLTLRNGATFATNVPSGRGSANGSISFPDSGSGQNTPAAQSASSYNPLVGSGRFTILAWVKRENTDANNNNAARIVSDEHPRGLGANAGLAFRFSGSDGQLALRANDQEAVTSIGGGLISPTNGQWHHVAVVYDGARPATNTLTRNVHFYVDGVQCGDGNVLSNEVVESNEYPLTLGNASAQAASTTLLVGNLSEVRILRDFAPDAVGNGNTNSVIACYRDAVVSARPPTVWISSPPDNYLTNATTLNVAVSYSNTIGYVGTVALMHSGTVVGSYENPAGIVSSQKTFNAQLSTLNEGTNSFQATAYSAGYYSGVIGTSAVVHVVIDRTAPVVACPANITTNTASGTCNRAVTFSASATDSHDGTTSVTCSPASGSTFNKGTNTVNCSSTDTAGNTGTCSFTVTVNDAEAPAVTCPGDVTVNTASGLCSSNVSFSASASDNCDSSPSVTCSPSSGSTFNNGTNTVNCSSTDAAGNNGSCSFTVMVNDNQAPTISCPANITTNIATGETNAVVSFSASASDNCEPGTVNCEPASGTAFSLGDTTVNCTVIDANSLSASCSFTITVNSSGSEPDTTPPSITPVLQPEPNASGWNKTDVVVHFQATDSESGVAFVTPDVTLTQEGADQIGEGIAVDNAGNTNSATAAVSIDKTLPTLTGEPADGQTVCTNEILLVVQYSDEVSALDLASLHAELDGNDITSLFDVQSQGALARLSGLSSGSHAWVTSISDLAGNTNTASATFTVDTSSPCTPAPTNFNISTVTEMPDVGAIWIQGVLGGPNTSVSGSVNFAEPFTFNVKSNDFGAVVSLPLQTNILIVRASSSSANNNSVVFRITRTTAYRAAITSPTFGAFANGTSQTVSGYVSAKWNEGQPNESEVVSVTINGVGTSLGTADGNGNRSFTTTTPVAVATNGSFTSLNGALTTASGQSRPIPPGLAEGYQIVRKKGLTGYLHSSGEPGRQIIRSPEAENFCGNDNWAVAGFGPAYVATQFSIDALIETNTLYSRQPSVSCITVSGIPDLTDVPLRDPIDTSHLFGPANQPSSWSLGIGESERRLYRIEDTDGDGTTDYELITFDWASSPVSSNSITFTAPQEYRPNTPVFFTFTGVDYARAPGEPLDLSLVTYRGESPAWWSNETRTVSFWLKLTGCQEYVIDESELTWPPALPTTTTNYPSAGVEELVTITGDRIVFTGFHNAKVDPAEVALYPDWHHMLPQAPVLRAFFESKGLDIDSAEFGWILDVRDHTQEPDALHRVKGSATYEGRTWNQEWQHWKNANPDADAAMIRAHLEDMKGDNVWKEVLAKGKSTHGTTFSHSRWLNALSLGLEPQKKQFIVEWASARKGAVAAALAKIGMKCRIVTKPILDHTTGIVIGFGIFVVYAAAGDVEAAVDSLPLRSDYVLGETIGETINVAGWFYWLRWIWDNLQPNPEMKQFRQRMFDNAEELLIDGNQRLDAGDVYGF